MAFELNPQQQHATKEGVKWFREQPKQTFEIVGPAGTGKTTIVREIVSAIGLKPENVLFMAYVGKATQQLAMAGNFAKTIHSTIYNLEAQPRLGTNNEPMMEMGRPVTVLRFVKRTALPKNISLLVIDEGGMVNREIGLDILSFGIPVIVLGDLDQLPPVFGDSFFLKKPDIILNQIMRQAEGSPIIHLASLAREGKEIPYGCYGDSNVLPIEELQDEHMMRNDIIICGRNSTRDDINNYMRHTLLKRTHDRLMLGDKVICRQNNWQLSVQENINLINGLIGYIETIYWETYNGKSVCIDFRPEFLPEGTSFRKIRIDYRLPFLPTNSPEAKGRSFFNKFQFAYAISCHLSQGSQYPATMYYRERLGSRRYQAQLDYTAITRAQKSIDIFY